MNPQLKVATYRLPIHWGAHNPLEGSVINPKRTLPLSAMPHKPRTHKALRSQARTLKSMTDSSRYGSEWKKLRLDVLARDPVCYCGLFRYEKEGSIRVHQSRDHNPELIAPAVLVDHIMPLSRGGDHSLGNLQSMCNVCHSIKTKLYG